MIIYSNLLMKKEQTMPTSKEKTKIVRRNESKSTGFWRRDKKEEGRKVINPHEFSEMVSARNSAEAYMKARKEFANQH